MRGSVVMDPVTGEYVTYDENGNEVSRFNPLTAFTGLGSAPSGGSTTIGADGKAVPVTTAPIAPQTPQQALPTTTSPDTGTTYSSNTSSGRSYNQRSSGRSSNWYDDPGYSDPFAGVPSSFGANEPTPPMYADGSMHPSQGGLPRVPGGMWNTQPDDGISNQKDAYVPSSGASANAFGARAADPVSGGMTGNYGSQGGSSSGGGGGSNMGANSALGQQMAGKVRGMASNITGGGSASSTSADPTKQYRRQGRRMDRANEQYYEDLQKPKPLPVRGWVKEQGYKPGSVAGLLDEPGAIYATEHNLNQFTDHLTDLPMTDIALMSFGTEGRDLMSRTPVTKVPAILRQNGVKPTKPDYKFTVDPSKVANKIAQMYGTIGNINTTDLLGNLATASKNSAVRQGLRQQFEYDPGMAVSQMENYIQSAAQMNANRGTAWGFDRSEGIHRRMLEMTPEILNAKPKRADRAIQQVANEFL